MVNVRQPNEVHRMKGTYRKDRHGAEGEELKITEPLPNPPNWLNDDAIMEWMRIVDVMSEYNMLKATDVCILALYCQLYAELQRQREQFTAAKMVQLRQCMNDLGLTPVSRSKLRVPDASKKKTSGFDNI